MTEGSIPSKQKNQTGSEYMIDIDKIADAMNLHYTPSKKATSKTASYETIAKHYIDLYCEQIIMGILYNRDLFTAHGEIHLNATLINKQINYQYNNGDRWLSWLTENFPVVTMLERGNNKTKVLTRVKPSKQILEYIMENEKIQPVNTRQRIEEIKSLVEQGEPYQDTEIDCDNLHFYIRKTQITLSEQMDKPHTERLQRKLLNNIITAQNILEMAEHPYPEEGVLRQVYKISDDADRAYLKGINLQTCSSEVRTAALGNCVELDLNNFVYCYYADIIAKSMQGTEVKKLEKFFIVEYARNKDRIRNELADVIYNNWEGSKIRKDAAKKIAKTALTAMSFGSKSSGYWLDASGKPHKGAIRDIIKNETARKAFESNYYVKGLKKELAVFFKTHAETLKQQNPIYNDTTRFTGNAAIVSHAFRVKETNIMLFVQHCLQLKGIEVKLWVHDAVYVDAKCSDSIVQDINYAVADEYKTDLFVLHRSVPNWKWENIDARLAQEAYEREHHNNILAEEERAKQYNSDFAVMTEKTDYAKINNQIILGRQLVSAVDAGQLSIEDIETDPKCLSAYRYAVNIDINRKVNLYKEHYNG